MMKHGAAMCLVAMFWITVGAVRAAEPLPIAEGGRFVVDLVLDPELDAKVREDFVRVLTTLTGEKPNVADGRSKRGAIVVGTTSFASFGEKYQALTGEDQFQIAVDGGSLHLVGSTRQAAHFAIYAFLEDLGCRWFMPGQIGEVLPKLPNLVWSGKPRREKADFSFRQIWWSYGGPPETAEDFNWWKLRNKVAYPRINHGHNLTNTVPPAKYFAKHPEYYALVAGKRKTSQLCTSNPDVIRLSIKHVNEYFDANPDVLSYSLCPDDNEQFCECANCRALDTGRFQDKKRGGNPIVTDRLMVYMNAVARGIQKTHPGKKVTTYAYVSYSTPPEREKVDPNVIVVFTTSVYCAAHGIGDVGCDSRQQMKRDLEAWAKACQGVYIYEYDPVPFNAELPWPMYGTHIRALPVYKKLGIRGFSFEGHNSWATLFPNFYISARMMWDTDQDHGALMDDLCKRFFGPAGPAMRAYYVELDRAIAKYPEQADWGQDAYPGIFSPEVMAGCRRHLDRALEAGGDSKVKARVGMVRIGFEYFERYLICRRAPAMKMSFEKYLKARSQCEAVIDKMYAINKDFILAHVAKMFLAKGLNKLESEHYVGDKGMVNHWMLLGPFDNSQGAGHSKAYPPENAVNLSEVFEGKDGKRLKWFEYRGKPSEGIVDLGSLVQPKDWSTAYAVCQVNSPKEQVVQFRVGSNDSVKIWLNGRQVWDNPLPKGRQLTIDDDRVPVTLPKGESQLLLKICNQAYNWSFCFRITDKEGNAIKNLRYHLPK